MGLRCLVVTDPYANARPATLEFRGERIATVSLLPDCACHAVAVPGLIDSHTHPLQAGLETLGVNLRGAHSVAEVLERVRNGHGVAQPGSVLLAFNLEPDQLVERRYPTTEELNGVAPGSPLLVYRVDGHSACLNAPALALLVADGWSFPTPSDGVLRGEAYESASFLLRRHLSPDVIAHALRVAGDAAARAGITTLGAMVGDPGLRLDEWRVLVDALAAMKVRAVPYLQTWDTAVPRLFGLTQIGGCLLVDGSFGSHTAWIAQPYADDPARSGQSYLTDERLAGFIADASSAGLQTAFHAIGDAAVEQVVRCHEAQPSVVAGHRIEHAELLSSGLIERIAAQKLMLAVQPAFEAEWGGPGRMYATRLGERWRRTNPYRSLLDAGVTLAGGSDWPITLVNPLAGIRAAVSHPNPAERITAAEALAMFTTGAARAVGLGFEAGTIEPGRNADITLLDADPRTDPAACVIATCVRGRWVHIARRELWQQAVSDV